MSWLWDIVVAVVDWTVALVDAVWQAVWGWVWSYVDLVETWIMASLPPDWATRINAVVDHLDALRTYMNAVDYWVPVYGSLTLLLGVFMVVAQIRLVRIILRVTPLVNG